MPVIKVKDIAHARLRAPDLDVMEEFLTDFGLIRSERTRTALYMRGSDTPHHLHVTELGEPRLLSIAYEAGSEDDLKRVASVPGASAIEEIDEPGGGRRVRLTEPNGYQIEIVHGIKTVAPIPLKEQELNSGFHPLRRAGEVMRPRKGPARIKRIGHAVIGTPKIRETLAWFRDTLGFICSDDVYVGDEDNLIGSFNRCDRGEEYVDHHSLFVLAYPPHPGLNHISFEVYDVDDVFMGHEHLRSKGKYEHMWGIGRHTLGSQIYDYWADPWGRVHEHWADSDRINVHNGSNLVSAEIGLASQWGERVPEKMLTRITP